MSERREFLERSLADLDEEHDAGDLSDDDHARLRAEYEERLAVLDGRRKRPAAGVGAHRAAGLAADRHVGRRGRVRRSWPASCSPSTSDAATPATTSPASTSAPATTAVTAPAVDEALSRCFDLPGGEAIGCFIDYTEANPQDPDGFLYFGLFSINQGLQSDTPELLSGGETFLRRALELDPELHEARVNLAVFLERTGRDDEAAAEMAQLVGVDLPDDLEQLAEFVRSNLAETTTTAPADRRPRRPPAEPRLRATRPVGGSAPR